MSIEELIYKDGENMNEWQILRNGKVWYDRFDTEDLAIEHMDEDVRNDDDNFYEVVEMTDEEMAQYQ